MGGILGPSWKTTALGILAAVLILSNQAIAVLDSDPLTNVSFVALSEALGLLGIGWFSRDNNVSSEKAGAK